MGAFDIISREFPKYLREVARGQMYEKPTEQSVMRPLAMKPETEFVRDIGPADVAETAFDAFAPLGLTATDAEAKGPKLQRGGAASGVLGKALRAYKGAEPVTKAEMRALIPAGEEDIARSIGTDARFKGGGTIPAREIKTALRNRETYRAEPRTLPKPAGEMSEQEWKDWGNQYGVDMSVTPMQSLGVSDIATKREVMVPGGLEGKFTIPDLFQIKANNFDPTVIGKDKHNELMAKFLRTYQREGTHDPVDTFNDLNFALLSPNAPLTQNEFLAQRFRIRTPEELSMLADRAGEPNLSAALDRETGTGAAARGGLGVKGTAEIGSQAELARLLREKPEMFHPGEGETLRDVGWRVMNQVPGLSVKTASLGVPWTDLSRANTSAVDLWMIRKNFERLANENPEFAARLNGLLEKNPSLSREEAAINIIGGGHPEAVYRTAKGDLHPNLPASLAPDKLAHEPEKFTMPNQFYRQIMDYVDESRVGAPHELFPEQWRLWDTYRGRVEPHEMAHPDWRKLPKQSFSELQDALQEHRRMGYMSAPDAAVQPTNQTGDWRRLYYGQADPKLLGATAGVLGAPIAGNYVGEKVRQLREKKSDDQKGE